MYVAVKGGEKAIRAAHQLLAKQRRGDPQQPELQVGQIDQQLALAVDRVMGEGGVYDRELAALAIKQAAGDLFEAIFLLRAYRTTLAHWYVSKPLDTANMQVSRRISATYKDLPGGQQLGATFDYTHRLLDFKLLAEGEVNSTNSHDDAEAGTVPADDAALAQLVDYPRVLAMLEREGLMVTETDSGQPAQDITQDPPNFPYSRSARLQALARGDEGFLLALGYSTQRGYGRNHPFVGEIRIGEVELWIEPEELGFAISIGQVQLSECEMVNGFAKQADGQLQFTRGYGLSFGQSERKSMAMALLDRALQADDYDEPQTSPAQQQEFVLSHCDNVAAAGFVSHLKLPHYVDFQAELELLRKVRSNVSDEERADD
ncbi:carbon-phosphorus lyase complex subunit PhnI [Celerinatantimonas yamalensis]|uniref:Carbon-phosphorus lyase complex subunit PhnI n=1 Tax=Celerinatantimonas yamalensis TaxID=559956 RepID=A0ABW9G8F4_9GAMM